MAERTAEAQQRAEQLRALAVQLSQAEQKERQRLALLLHDHLQQILVGAKFHVGILRGQLAGAEQRESLKMVDDLLDESLDTSRGLTVDLCPPVLQHGTMGQVLTWLADWMRKKHGLVVKVQADERAHPQASEMRVLLADDHAVMRDGLAQLLATASWIEVVGKAANGRQAVDLATQLQPDIVIMDVNMPEMDGVEATRCIMGNRPGTKVIGLSMFNDEAVARSMMVAGAADYLAKTSGPEALITAIRNCAGMKLPSSQVGREGAGQERRRAA